eukprot:TRINITY_DN62487_c0_g1_i1.p1 TRINITY_DN62487_c0_g1~~TRINITY_DN62487_c0_g1_i1.p1  ORF type:complete len:1059 (-),score=181.98 TRINITY_DN62487_c0_g1_i1:64-3240(-)
MASSRATLLEDAKKQREAREIQRRQREEEESKKELVQEAAQRIQRFIRGALTRHRWADEEWRKLQKQVADLDKLAQMMRQKGQQFIAPCNVLVKLMLRSVWQPQKRERNEELAQTCGSLAAFVVGALNAPLGDSQRSFFSQFDVEASEPQHVPEASRTLLRFARFLLSLVTAANSAAGVCELAGLLDAHAWGHGRALKESPLARPFTHRLLEWTMFDDIDPRGIEKWRVAINATIGVWPGDSATVPERLRGLVGIVASCLRLAEGTQLAFAELLEVAVAVPRIGSLLAAAQATGSKAPFPWARLLRAYATRISNLGKLDASGEGKYRSAKMLDREYALVYASGNLWELHVLIGLPLQPFLVAQAALIEHVEVSMLPNAPSHGIDEPVAVQALRRQLGPIIESRTVMRLFGDVLRVGQQAVPSIVVGGEDRQERRAGLARLAGRASQRHCVAIALFDVSQEAVEALCRIYSILFLKARASMRAARGGSCSWGPQVFSSLANTIAYMEQGDVARVLWRFAQGFYSWRGELCRQSQNCYHVLHLQATLLSQLLSVMSNEELRDKTAPFHEQDVAEYVSSATRLIAELTWTDGGDASLRQLDGALRSGALADGLLEQLSRVITQLQTFAARAHIVVPAECWHAPPEILEQFKVMVDQISSARGPTEVDGRAERLLRYAPHSVPFTQRVSLLRFWIQNVRERYQGLPATRLIVRRSHLFEDCLVALSNANWHSRFQVVFVNAAGRPEPGQDAGGLFKEFLEKLAETIFNPEYGLFRATESRLLFPNPEAKKYHDRVDKLFEFLGLVIGKAIFEEVCVEPSFAPFFLAKLLGKHNSYYDLASLDPGLLANLQRLKEYDGDVEDLCCYFVASSAEGNEVSLVPDGQNVPVTRENRMKYIYLLSDFKLNTELKLASSAFHSGFLRLVDERWLRMFGENELQQVISGSQSAKLDIDDLRRHTRLSNCSGGKDKVVVDFFSALKAMKPEHLVLLLRFVTSCSRAPLLGFGHLVPPFTIHKVTIKSDSEKLPTASTCFNTLKLPTYSSWKVMKQKLEFVVEQGAGFELD